MRSRCKFYKFIILDSNSDTISDLKNVIKPRHVIISW